MTQVPHQHLESVATGPRRLPWLLFGLTGLLVASLAGIWIWGGFDDLGTWAREGQRAFQNAMADVLRRLKTGEAGALAALLGLTFGYGFFHAAGPGHGKVLIGGYGLGSGIRLMPLVAIALASSLAQATTAVAMVYAGVFIFEWTRTQMVGATEAVMAPISYAAIGLIGLWLAWRGARRLWRRSAVSTRSEEHDHRHGHGGHGHPHQDLTEQEACTECGHSHGPSLEQVRKGSSWRDALLLVAGVAIRPCSGALFLLIISWRMGIDLAGILGAYVMALGTASVTVAVAILSVMARGSVLAAGSRFGVARALAPVLELVAGAVVTLVALQLLLPFL